MTVLAVTESVVYALLLATLAALLGLILFGSSL